MSIINRTQWYVITAIGGKEESIAEAIREKMNNYGYANFAKPSENEPSANFANGAEPKVKEVRVFMKPQSKEEIFNKNDPNMPKTLKNSKTVRWEALPDGRYKRIKTKRVNRFPSYIFINANLEPEIWYAIRNTIGILGFVGSTGKGALPIPCSMDEYERLVNEQAAAEYANKIALDAEVKQAEAKEHGPKVVLSEAPFKVGQKVVVVSGSFEGIECNVVALNLEKQIATVEYDIFGRMQSFDIGFNELKLAE